MPSRFRTLLRNLRGRRFSPLQRADDGATLRRGRGPALRVVPRRVAPFHRLSLAAVPRNRRREATRIQCGLLDPSGDARPWVVTRGEQALAWLLPEDDPRAVPESLDLVTGPPGGAVLAPRLDGYEAASFDDRGLLRSSRYFAAEPDDVALQRFLRSAGLGPDHPIQRLGDRRDWSAFDLQGRPLAGGDRLERARLPAAALAFTGALLFVAFQTGAWLFERNQQDVLEERIVVLQDALAPALRWQSLAMDERDEHHRLAVAVPAQDVLADIAALSEILRAAEVGAVHYFRSDGDGLRIRIAAASERLPELVKWIEDSPTFRAVAGEPVAGNQLELRFEREPA